MARPRPPGTFREDRDRGPENFSETLGRLFTARGWGRITERERLERAWAAAAGPEAAAGTRVAHLRRGVLEVHVTNATLMQELTHFRKRPLLEALRAALPGTTLSDIKFRAGAW